MPVIKSFIHIRDHDEEGNLLNYGGATLAYWVHRQADSLLIQYSAAECQEEDRFVKKLGRDISSARLEAGTYYGSMEIPNDMEEEIEKLIVHDYLNYKEDFWKKDYPDANIRHFWYPHRPGYQLGPEEGFEDAE